MVIIGAGAGGLMAAGRAAECGARVLLLERGPCVGRKLRICGKGRANITNAAEAADFVSAFGANGKFLHGVFSRFFNNDLVSFFRRLGVETKIERGGRIFPASDDANQVADALEAWVRSSGGEIKFNSRVRDLSTRSGRVTGVQTCSGSVSAKAIVLATGGITYPKTGSTGDGYRMLRDCGHKIVEPRPALTAIACREKWAHTLQGLSLRNVEAKLTAVSQGSRPRLLGKQFGEMLFTHFGVSGPIILTLSRLALDAQDKSSLELSIDLKPALSEEMLSERFSREMNGARHFRNYLPELLPRSMGPVIAGISGIPESTPLRTITIVQRRMLIQTLKALRLSVTGLRPPEEAIVTAGGTAINEIDPRTMESKLVKGLYLAGEVIDIDATTGGYNLQAAFSTGWVAGENAAKTL